MEPPVLVRFHDICVRFAQREVLSQITTQIKAGQLTALIGPNGSGKTTLLKVILGLVPYSGKLDRMCSRKEIGLVPQSIKIDRSLPMSVAEFASCMLRKRPLIFGVGRKNLPYLQKVLARVHADHLLNRPLGVLSGGELQRVMLAIALEPTPKLLLLDEPATGMDVEGEFRFYDTLHTLIKEHNTAVVMVSHDLSVVHRITDHVLCLNRSLMCEGSAQDILTDKTISEVFGSHSGIYHHHHHHEE